MIAKIRGIIKNIPICLNKALLISFSSQPSFLSILNLFLLSLDSDNSFNAKIAALDIKKIIPRYKPIKVAIPPNPVVASAISNLVLIFGIM